MWGGRRWTVRGGSSGGGVVRGFAPNPTNRGRVAGGSPIFQIAAADLLNPLPDELRSEVGEWVALPGGELGDELADRRR